jgi:peptidoglycan/xylan/chitin deacetylase (PgdA/CDA1 family)
MPSLSRIFTLPSRIHRRARRRRAYTMFIVASVFLTIFVTLYSIYKPPSILITYFQYRWPSVLWRINTEQKVIALTIDDAPSEYTPEILDVLKENGATATFFVIGGQVSGRESTLHSIVVAGNELGNHAMHDEPSASLTDEQLKDQIKMVEAMIARTYSSLDEPNDLTAPNGLETHLKPAPPRYFRPGSGFFSTRMLRLARALGYRVVLGNVYPHDAQISSWRLNAAHILSMVQPGSVVICHDRRQWTVPMLKKVLPELKKRGYRVVSITQLLKEASERNQPDRDWRERIGNG